MSTRNHMTGVLDIGTIEVDGRFLRIGKRDGQKGVTPLLLFNGVGANLELVEPFVAALERSIGVVIFDVPGVGGSPTPRTPYRFSGVAHLGDRLSGW